MTTTATDISVVLSGGTTNISPLNSIGGDPSSTPVTDAVLNNLFSDVSSDESADGLEDYRCVYVFNDGDTAVYDVELWIYDDFEDGATMEIGIESRDESQRITISGDTVTGGTLTLSYGTVEFVTSYNSDLGEWASELEDTLLALINPTTDAVFFKELSVIAGTSGSDTIIFDIRFSGKDGKRNFEKIQVVSNDLTPTGPLSVVVTAPSEGSPVNTLAQEINVSTTPPGGVGFSAASQISPVTVPRLMPTEGFPLWIKRVVAAGTEAKENDGFKLRFRAESLETT